MPGNAKTRRPELDEEEGTPEAKKFPGTMDAAVWASRCTAWFGAFKVPDLTEWFRAALSRGFRNGEAAAADAAGRFDAGYREFTAEELSFGSQPGEGK